MLYFQYVSLLFVCAFSYGSMRSKKTCLKYHVYIIFLCFCGQHPIMQLALGSNSFTERLVKKGKDLQGATQRCS